MRPPQKCPSCICLSITLALTFVFGCLGDKYSNKLFVSLASERSNPFRRIV